ncbi:hypothetical protein ACROYT_G041450 [Oculina patagonica]
MNVRSAWLPLFFVKVKMNTNFHLCLLLIILGTITVQGAVTKKNFFAKRGGVVIGRMGGVTSFLIIVHLAPFTAAIIFVLLVPTNVAAAIGTDVHE